MCARRASSVPCTPRLRLCARRGRSARQARSSLASSSARSALTATRQALPTPRSARIACPVRSAAPRGCGSRQGRVSPAMCAPGRPSWQTPRHSLPRGGTESPQGARYALLDTTARTARRPPCPAQRGRWQAAAPPRGPLWRRNRALRATSVPAVTRSQRGPALRAISARGETTRHDPARLACTVPPRAHGLASPARPAAFASEPPSFPWHVRRGVSAPTALPRPGSTPASLGHSATSLVL